MREQEVTLTVAKYLDLKGWEILSLNNPFSGKAIWIKPKGGFRGKGTLIPDIIAKKNNNYIVVESYEKLKIKDIPKLTKYSSLEYFESFKEIFNKNNINLIKALAYPEPIVKYKYPKDFILFGVKKDFEINIYCEQNSVFIKNNLEFEISIKKEPNIFI